MVNLMLEMGGWMSSNGIWGRLLGLFFNLIKNMGWTIVIFTICLKLVLIPLDIYQRHISTTTSEKQAEMKPELDKVQKLYGSNPEMLNKKTMEVYRNHNFNMGTSCLGLLINMVLTLVIFITLFNSLRTISNTLIAEQYQNLRQTYVQTYRTIYDEEYVSNLNNFTFLSEEEKNGYNSADEYAKSKVVQKTQLAVYEKYDEIKESWLWIKNIYLTDTATSPFPSFETYVKNAGVKFTEGYVSLENEINGTMISITDEVQAKEQAKIDYNLINGYIISSVDGKWNGFYILILLAGVVTWLSTKVTRLGQPKQMQEIKLPNGQTVQKEVDPMAMMSWLLPIMMVFFTWSYTGLFAIYIVVNSMVSILTSLAIYYVRNFIKKQKGDLTVKATATIEDYSDYRRYDKYTIIDDGLDSKKNKNKNKGDK